MRAKREEAKQRTEEIIEKYDMQVLAGLNVKLLSDQERLAVAIARAHFRKIGFVVIKNLEKLEIDLSKWTDAYIVQIV